MKGCPLEYQRHGSSREVAPEDGKRLYLSEGLVFAIFGMEMCGTVVSKVHSNHNPKESSYLRHFLFPFYLSAPAASEAASFGWCSGCHRAARRSMKPLSV